MQVLFFLKRQKNKHTKVHKNVQPGSWSIGQTGEQTDKQTHGQKGGQTERQTHRQTDRQTYRQTDRQTDRLRSHFGSSLMTAGGGSQELASVVVGLECSHFGP